MATKKFMTVFLFIFSHFFSFSWLSYIYVMVLYILFIKFRKLFFFPEYSV